MIRFGVVFLGLALAAGSSAFAGQFPNPNPPPPGIGSCVVRGDVSLPCSVADYYYELDDIIRNAPVRI